VIRRAGGRGDEEMPIYRVCCCHGTNISNLRSLEKKMGKQVALVIGASRGIGRQVAVDLAKNGYYGRNILCKAPGAVRLTANSRGRCKDDFRCFRCEAVSARPKLSGVHHQHRCPRNRRSRRQRSSAAGRRARLSQYHEAR
jgi:hypothetical protein